MDVAERPDRAAVLLPGMMPVHQSLLAFAEEAVWLRGGYRNRVWWSPPAAGDIHELVPWVRDQTAAEIDQVIRDRPGASKPLVVGKSLGTFGARVVADRELPAIWLTPVLSDPDFAAEYENPTAPSLLIGGTGDPMWDGDAARKLSPYVCEIADADHGMFVPHDMEASGRAHGAVGVAIERFLDEVVWTS